MKNRLRYLFTLLALVTALATVAATPAARNYRTHLAGSTQVPVRDTLGQGQAIFQLSEDGTELRYKLIVANTENVFMAHIHLAAEGANGPIVVWLYPADPFPLPPTLPLASWITGRFDGVLAKGTITAEDVIDPNPSDGVVFDFGALIAAMKAGNTYVNVHTNDFVAPANTGPGDFPAGEIRGQIDG